MKPKTLIIILVVVFCSIAGWAKPVMDISKSDGCYTLDFEVPQWLLEEVDSLGFSCSPGYAGERFSRIRVPGYKFMNEVGKPALPIFVFHMAVASLEQVPAFEVMISVEESVVLQKRYFPAQQPRLKSQLASEHRFDIIDSYYNSPGERTTLASVDEAFTIRGVPCVNARIAPFSYNPVENKITVMKKFTLKINTSTKKFTGLDSKAFENFLRYALANFELAVEPVINPGRKEDYLIISAPEFESGLSDFVTFRQKRFNVSLATTDVTGTSEDNIILYIKALNPTPAFLLLVGDSDKIPAGQGSGAATDLNYSSTEGDYHPEIFLGRFSVANSDELSNLTHKNIFMEELLYKVHKKNLFISSINPLNVIHNYVIDTYMDSAGYENIRYYCDSIPVPESELINTLNKGVLFNVFAGHGSSTSWRGKDFELTIPKAKNLVNYTSYFFTYSFACNTGEYDQEECFLEAFTRGKGGSVAAIGASISTSWTGDDEMEAGVFDAMFDHANPQTSVSASLNAAKMSISGSLEKVYHAAYNLLGDPALELFPIISRPFIQVYFPNGGEKFLPGTACRIKWGSNVPGFARVELFKSSVLKDVLADSTDNNGVLFWNIPGNYELGDDYKIRVFSLEDDTCIDESDGFFDIDIPVSVSTVANTAVKSYGLSFNNSCIHYCIPGDKLVRVSLKLYNIQGRLVRTLVDGIVSAGHHSVRPGKLANGLHLCSIEAGGFRKVIKVVKR